MEKSIWYLTDDFKKLPAKTVLQRIFKDDRKNYEKAEAILIEDIKLLDDAITLYIESIQAAYVYTDKWKDNVSTRASIAMIISTLNYIFLARHSVLLGYYPEARDLLRSCHERISCCYVFFNDDKFARRFLADKQIRPAEIRKELSKTEKDKDKRRELLKDLNKYYGFLSVGVHPNLKSFEARYGKRDLSKKVGLQFLFGGFMSDKHGHVSIIRVLQTVLSALRIIGIIIHDESGSWDKKYQEIQKKCDEMVSKL